VLRNRVSYRGCRSSHVWIDFDNLPRNCLSTSLLSSSKAGTEAIMVDHTVAAMETHNADALAQYDVYQRHRGGWPRGRNLHPVREGWKPNAACYSGLLGSWDGKPMRLCRGFRQDIRPSKPITSRTNEMGSPAIARANPLLLERPSTMLHASALASRSSPGSAR
jgi:hypothetical protein